MSAACMWLGLPVFFLAFIFVNIAKTRQSYLRKTGKAPDEKYARLNIIARMLFAAGIALWIIGAFMTIASGGK